MHRASQSVPSLMSGEVKRTHCTCARRVAVAMPMMKEWDGRLVVAELQDETASDRRSADTGHRSGISPVLASFGQ
jgi:hypothetical protein